MRKRWRIGALLTSAVMAVMTFAGCSVKEAPNVTALPQYSELTEGEDIAVITVRDYGTIKVRFFKEQAPKAVENFIKLAEEGFYDELNFHRVIVDFMIQGGDPKGNGSGGESYWGGTFEDEFDPSLRNFNGALSMANKGADTNGSQFFIVQNSKKYTDKELDQFEKQAGIKMPELVREKYKEVGGTPWLDDQHTVFGQVIEGMDVVDKIANCKVTYWSQQEEQPSKPVDEVLIESVKIEKYAK